MVRLRGNEVFDVGPRSAHIAGLHYAAFVRPEEIVDPRLELFRPKDGDPDDYAAIRSANGERYAITNTCAANVLGYAKPGWHAHGNAESARKAMAPLAQRLGVSVEETARRILEKASGKSFQWLKTWCASTRSTATRPCWSVKAAARRR